MESRTCTKCNTTKELTQFSKHKTGKLGRRSICKDCANKATAVNDRTLPGLVTKLYSSQKSSSKSRNHPAPDYTKAELRAWIEAQPNFKEVFDNWVTSGYKTKLRPSCDRLNDYKPYTLDNLQLTTWAENLQNYRDNTRACITNKIHTGVVQYSMDGERIAEYKSIKAAADATNANPSVLQQAAIGNCKYCANYQWRYAENAPESIGSITHKKIGVRQYTKSGEFIAEYESMSEASAVTKVRDSDISNVCASKRKSAGGFQWRYSREKLESVPAVGPKAPNTRAPGVSGHRGVVKSGNGKRWCAVCRWNKVTYNVGTYDTIEEAVKARADKLAELKRGIKWQD